MYSHHLVTHRPHLFEVDFLHSEHLQVCHTISQSKVDLKDLCSGKKFVNADG